MTCTISLFSAQRKARVLTAALALAACAGPHPVHMPLALLKVPPPTSPSPTTDEARAQSDRERLEQLLAQPGPDGAVANALGRFLPTMLSRDERTMVYSLMAKAYAAATKAGADADATVDAALCDGAALELVDATAMINAGYRLANDEVRLPTAARCLATATGLPATRPSAVADPAAVSRLKGTLLLLDGDMRRAVTELKRAAVAFEPLDDPLLHLRLVRALAATAARDEACGRAKALYLMHPLLPGLRDTFSACGEPKSVLAALDAERRRDLLKTRRDGGEPVKSLSLEDPNQENGELNLKDETRITVAVFFSTWCPHCNKELPRVNDFVAAVAADAVLKDRVRVVAIRTAVERETELYEVFLARIKPQFPIWTDPALSLAFGVFCKSLGLKPALPTVAVVDTRGIVRYVLGAGDYQDTASELAWAVQSLLDQPTSDKP